nr:MAG TPA: hypothetical protein [Caudoviricetes sp.]
MARTISPRKYFHFDFLRPAALAEAYSPAGDSL